VGKAQRAHADTTEMNMVGTLRFAHPTTIQLRELIRESDHLSLGDHCGLTSHFPSKLQAATTLTYKLLILFIIL